MNIRKLSTFAVLITLVGCAGLQLSEGEQIEAATNIFSNVAVGNYTGAILQGLDVLLVLLGIKGALSGAKYANGKLNSKKKKEKTA